MAERFDFSLLNWNELTDQELDAELRLHGTTPPRNRMNKIRDVTSVLNRTQDPRHTAAVNRLIVQYNGGTPVVVPPKRPSLPKHPLPKGATQPPKGRGKQPKLPPYTGVPKLPNAPTRPPVRPIAPLPIPIIPLYLGDPNSRFGGYISMQADQHLVASNARTIKLGTQLTDQAFILYLTNEDVYKIPLWAIVPFPPTIPNGYNFIPNTLIPAILNAYNVAPTGVFGAPNIVELMEDAILDGRIPFPTFTPESKSSDGLLQKLVSVFTRGWSLYMVSSLSRNQGLFDPDQQQLNSNLDVILAISYTSPAGYRDRVNTVITPVSADVAMATGSCNQSNSGTCELARWPLAAGITVDEFQTLHTRLMYGFPIATILRELGFPAMVTKVLPLEYIVFMLTRGYLPPKVQLNLDIKRYMALTDLPVDMIDTLRRLYNVSVESPDPVLDVASKPKATVEDFVVMVNDGNIAEAIAHIKMIPPPGTDLRRYFVENAVFYDAVFSRSEQAHVLPLADLSKLTKENIVLHLSILTDSELLDYLDIVAIPYTNRPSLLSTAADLVISPGFFIPRTRKCINTETTVEAEDIADIKHIVAYGTVSRYLCMDQPDIMGMFVQGEVIDPVRANERIGTDKVQQLLALLRLYPNDFPLAVQTVESHFAATQQLLAEEKVWVGRFLRFTPAQKNFFSDFFYKMFYSGMYARRWGGPGCPYPITEAQTSGNVTPEHTTTGVLLTLIDMWKTNRGTPVGDFLDQLPVYKWSAGNWTVSPRWVRMNSPQWGSTGPLISMILVVGKHLAVSEVNMACIRWSSAEFIGSAVHYLQIFLSISIPDVDITRLAHVI